MDRINQLREPGSGRKDNLDVSTAQSEAFLTAQDSSSSKFFSFSDDDPSVQVSKIKDVTLSENDVNENISNLSAITTVSHETTLTSTPAVSKTTGSQKSSKTNEVLNISPITKQQDQDSFKLSNHIDAANILSGGVDIFDDNDNSYDGNELVIDDNAESADSQDERDDSLKKRTDIDVVTGLKTNPKIITDDEKSSQKLDEDSQPPAELTNEVILQIDGKNVDAIDIGNGLYLYRKENEELTAIQIIEGDDLQSQFKFLKVRHNAEGNLEVYEEIVEPSEDPQTASDYVKAERAKESKPSHLPIRDLDKVSKSPGSCKTVAKEESNKQTNLPQNKTDLKTQPPGTSNYQLTDKIDNGKFVKNIETSRKSPLNFTAMTFSSKTTKDGVPLTKSMIDQQFQGRSNDAVKKTIEVSTENLKTKSEKACKSDVTAVDKQPNEKPLVKAEKTDAKHSNIEKQELKGLTANMTVTKDDSDMKTKDINVDTKLETNKSDLKDSLKKIESTLDNNKASIPSMETTKLENYSKVEQPVLTDDKEIILKDKTESPKIVAPNPFDINKPLTTKLNKDASPKKDSVKTDIFTTKPISNVNTNSKTITKQDSPLSRLDMKTPAPKFNTKVEQTLKSPFKQINIESVTSPPKKEFPKIDEKQRGNTDAIIVPRCNDNKPSFAHSQVKEPFVKQENTKLAIEKVVSIPTLTVQSVTSTNLLNRAIADPKSVFKAKSEIDPKAKESKSIAQTFESLSQSKDLKTNITAVPFGKWTEANKQEYLNKIKDSKNVPTNSQIKLPNPNKNNDLNSRDFVKKTELKKDPQIQHTNPPKTSQLKVFEAKVTPNDLSKKVNVKNETTVTEKQSPKKPTDSKALQTLPTSPKIPSTSNTENPQVKAEHQNRRNKMNTMNDLIDRTIEDIIMERLSTGATNPPINHMLKDQFPDKTYMKSQMIQEKSLLDDIEMQMNELHGKPFVEKPNTDKVLEQAALNVESNVRSRIPLSKNVPKLLPLSKVKAFESSSSAPLSIADNELSEEEIFDSEPVTGDSDLNWKTQIKINAAPVASKTDTKTTNIDFSKDKKQTSKDGKGITEGEFDKFARRNSTTYENCFTVNVENNDKHKIIQSVVEKDQKSQLKTYQGPNRFTSNFHNKEDLSKYQSKPPQVPIILQHEKQISPSKQHYYGSNVDEQRNYPTKVQMAYQSALTEKRQKETPIKILEDKPVKVVFVESETDFVPYKLNAQGSQLACTEKPNFEEINDASTLSSCDSVESEINAIAEDKKETEQNKIKSKHQRKQVLTPVETPDLVELIQPEDLGLEDTYKKKRKMEDNENKKNAKSILPKKNYLLGRATSVVEDKTDVTKSNNVKILAVTEPKKHLNKEPGREKSEVKSKSPETVNLPVLRSNNTNPSEVIHKSLEDNQPIKLKESPNADTPKRGRGRPRKHPIPETVEKNEKVSPKKAKLSESHSITSEEDDDDDSDDETLIRENWTMGKINENIVCPICNKLFRSESVVDKHVTHCLKSLNGSIRSVSESSSSNSKVIEKEIVTPKKTIEKEIVAPKKTIEKEKVTPKKTIEKEIVTPKKTIEKELKIEKTSKSEVENRSQSNIEKKPNDDKAVADIKDEQNNYSKETKTDKSKTKPKLPDTPMSRLKKIMKTHSKVVTKYTCEICGKNFRQLSYLVSHKAVHKEQTKRRQTTAITEPVLSCETCGKDFRKLHHLVQHRVIHNQAVQKLQRKASSELSKEKEKEDKIDEQHGAGFRCEPCDKSFRKLHHLVEHRETHDGVNRQKNTAPVEEKAPDTPQCEICGKSFRKLHHLIEHREQHNESAKESEKDDDKTNKKPSLFAKDIIHECFLCYMVFPNEPSLNKHMVNCQKKKKTAKQSKDAAVIEDKAKVDAEPIIVESEIQSDDDQKLITLAREIHDAKAVETATPKKEEIIVIPEKTPPKRTSNDASIVDEKSDLIAKEKVEVIKTETPKKRPIQKEKIGVTVSKRAKTLSTEIPIAKTDTCDSEDEIRYMLNPDFKNAEEEEEQEIFMKVRDSMRDSLSFKSTLSKQKSLTRRTSYQHPPTGQRTKRKSSDKSTKSEPLPNKKATTSKPVPSHDQDDEIKYSFPKSIQSKLAQKVKKTPQKKVKTAASETVTKKNLVDRRKSLTGIAKRKSLGKTVSSRHKVEVKAEASKPVQIAKPKAVVKKRMSSQVEHKCDCGKLFSSSALLHRHTSVDHTPPRIRKVRNTDDPEPIQTKKTNKKSQKKVPFVGVPLTEKMKKIGEIKF